MPRISKDPEVRRDEILDAAWELFNQKGYEQTTISDIARKVGVAQGLCHYYFKSKEELLDAAIERHAETVVGGVEAIGKDAGLNAQQKLQNVIGYVFGSMAGAEKLVDYVHDEKNMLMHQRIVNKALRRLVPLLSDITLQGVCEGILDAKYPEKTIQVLVVGIAHLHDTLGLPLNDEMDLIKEARVLEDILERSLGASKGSFRLQLDTQSEMEGDK